MGLSSSVCSFDKNRVSAVIVGSDSNSLIEESVEVFKSDSFVIAASRDMKVNGKSSADSLEESFKSAAVINDNHTTKSNLQKDFLDKETSLIMSCNVVSGINNDKASEITNNIHEVGFTTLIRNFAGLPKIDMKDAERAAVRPREDKLTVMSNGTISSETVKTFEAPIGNDFPTMGSKEPKTDAVKGFVDTHVAGWKGGMVGRENVAAERNRNNDEHQHFGVVLSRLGDNQFTLNKGQPIATDIIMVGRMKRIGISCGEWGALGQPLQHKLGVGVLVIRCKPIKRRRNWPSRRDCGNHRASDKFGWRSGSIDEGEKMDINEMIDEISAKLKRAAGRTRRGVGGRRGSTGNGLEKDGRSWVTGHQFGDGESTDIVGTKAGSKRETERSRELGWRLVREEGRLGSWEIRVKGKDGVRSGGRVAWLENCNRMRNSNRER
jgi:hypothetical protein